MGKSKGASRVINLKDTTLQRGKKRKNERSPTKSPLKKHPSSVTLRKGPSNKVWQFRLPKEKWFPGKITTSVNKGVLTNIQTNLSHGQKRIMMETCFAHFLDCHEIVIQPQLIHYFLLRQVYHPNDQELWFYVSGRYVRFSISKFCLVTGLRCFGDGDTQVFESRPSQLRSKYFSNVDSVIHEDVKNTFISACQMPDLDLVEVLPDIDVAMIGALYLCTHYLFPRDYKKVVDNFLFALVEDFSAMNSFPWGKLLFEITLVALKDGLSRRTPHYRLRGMLVAFQAWIYETFPSLDGNVVTRLSTTHPRIKNWIADEQPSATKLEGDDCFSNPIIEICDLEPSKTEMEMPYMTGVQYKKPVQPRSSREGHRSKSRMYKSADSAGTSGKSVLLLTDSSIGQADVPDDDDDFVDHPPIFQEASSPRKSPIAEGPSEAHPSPKEAHSHGDALKELSMHISELKSQNVALSVELEDIKSQLSSMKAEPTTKMNYIVQMQGQIKTDLRDIMTNMQFLSETVSAMISSSMDEIMRRFADKTTDHGVGDVKGHGVRDTNPQGIGGSEKSDEVKTVEHSVDMKGKGKLDPSDDLLYFPQSPSFDLGVGCTQPDVLHSEDIQKQMDSIISEVVSATKNIKTERSPTAEPKSSNLPVKRVSRPTRILQSPFVAGEGKLFKHDDNIAVFEKYKDVEEVDRSAFMAWFQRGYKPKNRKKFREDDDIITHSFLIGSFPVGYKSWFYQLINSESSLSSQHMDACFFYIRQVALHAKKVMLRATTTNSWFQHKIKDIYPTFMKDPNVLMSESSLIDVITGHVLPLSVPWADVDYVFMPILPTNKAHWMLGVLQFRSHTLTVFNSAGKSYRDWKVLQGIEPYVKILPVLMSKLGISKKDPDYHEPDCMELKVIIDDTLPQQTNGHDCGIFVILYALYILCEGRSSAMQKIDATKCRLDIATLLYKHREIYKKKAKQSTMGEGIHID